MCNLTKKRPLLGLLVLGATLSAVSLLACSVPVFRYALEHWHADLYQAVVFHRGPLSPSEQSLVLELSSDGMAGQRHANLALKTFDLDQNPQPDVLEFWKQVGTDTFPWLIVRNPARLPGNLLSSPLSEAAIKQVLDSSARQEIAQRLGKGESAVWVVLEIGEPQKDDAATQLLQDRLDYLSTVLELPRLEEQDIVNGLISVGQDALKLQFSVLRLSRNNPEEQTFVKMLLATEPDLNDVKEPIVIPIFGRGRALYALVGKGINHETIDEAATFLIGKCSCAVKDLNPGVDLLFAANWDQLLKAQPAAVEDLPELASMAESAPVTVTITGGAPSNSSESNSFAGNLRLITSLSIVGLAAMGIFLWRRK
jgi:hypothetical protein